MAKYHFHRVLTQSRTFLFSASWSASFQINIYILENLKISIVMKNQRLVIPSIILQCVT